MILQDFYNFNVHMSCPNELQNSSEKDHETLNIICNTNTNVSQFLWKQLTSDMWTCNKSKK
jgi:hypothetical protein